MRTALFFLCLAIIPDFALQDGVSEKNALMDFYNALDGPHWTQNQGWGNGEPCTSRWNGISCEDGLVIRIRLINNKLKGHLPSSLWKLEGLKYLELTSNEIEGSIPDEWRQFRNLHWILLGVNKLSGTLPDSICEIQQLTDVYLYDNRFTGTIPACYARWPNLHHLYLESNHLMGSLPNFGTYDTGNLEEMHMNGCNLTGTLPVSLANAKNLDVLMIQDNNFTGPIYDFLAQSKSEKLRVLDFSNNKFHGAIPNDLSHLKGLKTVIFNGNLLSGTLPSKVGPNLYRFEASNNSFTGYIPEAFSICSVLRLPHNKLYGSLPAFLQTYPSNMIGGIDLRWNQFWCGEEPDWCSYPPVGNGLCEPCVYADFCCAAHFTPSCDDLSIASCVCAHEPECCELSWDAGCVALVEKFDCGSCDTGPCCLNHPTPGCNNFNISQCVCRTHPECCNDSWTEECVEAVNELSCGICTGIISNCCKELPEPGCNNLEVSRCVCQRMPGCCRNQWTETCVEAVDRYRCGTCN